MKIDLDFNVLITDFSAFKLSAVEAEFLYALHAASPRVVSNDYLIQRVWGNQEPYDANNTLKTYSSRFNSLMRRAGIDGIYIKRVYGRGYALLPRSKDVRAA
jgi:DNA-binding response OmpR family regulator